MTPSEELASVASCTAKGGAQVYEVSTLLILLPFRSSDFVPGSSNVDAFFNDSC